MMITLALITLLPALVSAHGYVNKVVVGGTVYQGNSVGTSPTISSAIRQVNTNSPVKGANNPDINCGSGAQLAEDTVKVNPGDSMEVVWSGGTTGTSPWPHNTGPIMHYMAQCDGSCATYNSSNAKWFKISEQGQEPGNSTWYQAQLQTGAPAMVTIPSNLAAGPYLLRSELIALQLAVTEGGAEFYPSCIQLDVGGSQTGQPTSSEQVTFPGAYSDTDPGIYTPNVYNPGFSYVFPGPPVATLVEEGASSGSSGSGSGGGGSSASSAPTAPSPSAPSVTPPSTPTLSTPLSVPSSTPSSAPTGGGSSTCTRKRSASEARVVTDKKRMHRRRARTSH